MPVRDLPLDQPTDLFIGGEWVAPQREATTVDLCPADGEPLATIAEASSADVDLAVGAARRALDGPWSRVSPSQRGRILLRLAALLERHSAELARLESLDNGKPIRESSRIDVPLAVDCFEYYGGFTSKVFGETIPTEDGYLAYTVREPIGVVGAITPFNFPLLMAAWKIAPALACGNTVVIKPSPLTPLTTLYLARLAEEAGVPPGVLNVITGDVEAGEALVEHVGVDKVAFTGSTQVGKAIAVQASRTLKRVSLELGGKAPNIVLPDADLDDAVTGALFGVFWNQGQICTAGSRILVHRSILDEFVARFVDRARRIRVGHPLDPQTDMGPLVSANQQARVAHFVSVGKSEGAELLAGGGPPPEGELLGGFYFEPTVFARVTNEMTIAREEVFGPFASILAFSDLDEAVRIANDTSYGLTAGVWTRDLATAHRVAQRVRAGTIWINSYNVVTSEAPFGGFKESGIGREMGRYAIDLYTEVKQVYVGLKRPQPWFGSES